MSTDKKSNASEEEKNNEAEEKEETAESEQEEEEDTAEDEIDESESEEEEESEHIEKEERDFDSEIAEEEKLGKGEKEEEADEEEEDDDDKPVTRKELRRIEKTTLESTALTLARTLAESDKEAQLVVAKWKNRVFPKGMSLDAQVKEAFILAHGKNILGQSEEAKRALLNRRRTNNNSASTYREGASNPSEPKLPVAEKRSLELAGFKFNTKTKRYEKKVRGGLVIRNPKTKRAEFKKA